MKNDFYFNNVTTLEQLKEIYRRLCIAMHPDRGGSEEEFKAMQSEYERAALRFSDSKQSRAAADAAAAAAEEARRRAEERRREEEEARRYQEEERRRREKEEQEERERIEKERAALRPIIQKWAKKLEQVPEKKKDYSVTPAYRAAVVRNIKKILAHYFPGVDFKISLSWQSWKERTEISWTDGPSIEDVKKVEELEYFVNTGYRSDPYADYGDYYTIQEFAEWCAKFGCVPDTRITFDRYFSDLAKDHIYKMVWEAYPEADQIKDNDFVLFNESIYGRCEKFNAFVSLFGLDMSKARDKAAGYSSTFEMDYTNIFYTLKHCYNVPGACDVNKQPKDTAPKFRPTYGPKLKELNKVLGSNVFAYHGEGGQWKDSHRLEFGEMLDRVANGQPVYISKPYTGGMDNTTSYYILNRSTRKNDAKRVAAFASVGITIDSRNFVTAIDPEFVAAYRAELADIEQQCAQWEKAQQEAAESTTAKTKITKKEKTAAADTTDTTAEDVAPVPGDSVAGHDSAADEQDAAPADGLTLEDIPGGVAVVGSSRATYKNKKTIKAHGAKWKKDAQQWQATDPDAVASLRAWFALRDAAAPAAEESTTTAKESTTTAAEATAEDTAAEATAAAVVSLVATVADIIRTLQQCQEAEEQARQCEQLAAALSNLADIITTAAAYIAEEPTAAEDNTAAATVPGDSVAGHHEQQPAPFSPDNCARWSSRAASGDLSRVLGEICAALAALSPDMANTFNYFGMGFYSGDFNSNRAAHVRALAALVRGIPSAGDSVASFVEGLAA